MLVQKLSVKRFPNPSPTDDSAWFRMQQAPEPTPAAAAAATTATAAVRVQNVDHTSVPTPAYPPEFYCDVHGCDMRGPVWESAHALQAHSRERHFVCKGCGRVFGMLTSLERHRKVHDEVAGSNSGSGNGDAKRKRSSMAEYVDKSRETEWLRREVARLEDEVEELKADKRELREDKAALRLRLRQLEEGL